MRTRARSAHRVDSAFLIVLLTGLLLVAGAFAVPAVGRAADDDAALVAVPYIIGLTGAEAIAAVREAGLEPEPEIERDPDMLTLMAGLSGGELPAGVVYAAFPHAGTLVEPGSTVEFAVPPEIAIVPDVKDLSEAEAVAAIEAVGLVAALVVERDADVLDFLAAFTDDSLPSGEVLRVRPTAGQVVEPGSTVEITLTPTVVAVPDVVGLIGAEAIAAVREAGLEPIPEIEDDLMILEMMEGFAELGIGTLAHGEVYLTRPGAGELVEVGSTVTLKLPAQIVVVPDVVALPEDVAVAALEAAGLEALPMVADDVELEAVAVGYIDRPLPAAGAVLRTSPAGGERATAGTSVMAWLAPALVKVPDVDGLSEAEAATAIEAVGLVPVPVMFDADDYFGWDAYIAADGSLPPVGEVMGSLPIAGWPLAVGSSVELELMPPIVEVPNVLDLSEQKAVAAVQAAGLVADVYGLEAEPAFGFLYELFEEPVPVVVAVTDPAPGELVVEGSVVELGLPPDLLRIPDVFDQKPKRAAAAIEKAGFVPEIIIERGEDFLDAVNAVETKPLPITVLGTSPDAGSLAERGSTVVLHVPPKLAKVPDVIGLAPKKADARIEKAGFAPEIVVLEAEPFLGIPYAAMDGPVPIVVEMTYPYSGTLAERGSTVELGIPPDLVEVPRVVDLDSASAFAKIEAAGLVPDPWELDVAELSVALMFSFEGDLPDPDLVLYSTPVAGTLVEKGSAVELAFPPVLVEVPDVIGMTEADAVSAISAAGLVSESFTVEEDPFLAWIEVSSPPEVYATEPAGGELAAAGSTVALYLPPEPELDASAAGANARLVHTLFNLDPDEEGSTELVCNYTGSAIFETNYDSWSITYHGPNWHAVDGSGAFVCSGEVGERSIVSGKFTTDPLEFTRDEHSACELDEFSFDGSTISGVAHQSCLYPADVFTYAVLVDPE